MDCPGCPVPGYEYSPPMQYEVFCDTCGRKYLEQDPGVAFLHGDHVWRCTDETLCFLERSRQS